jgi:outer membrane immunogenic protein
MLGLAQSAFAADLDDALRGSTAPTYHWGGVYVGGQVGYSSAEVNFGNGVGSLIGFILRSSTLQGDVSDWTVLGQSSTASSSLGGFIGYNVEWEQVIVGLELNYNRVSVLKTASDSLSRSFIDNTLAPPSHTYTYTMTVAGSSSVHLTDVMTLRARTGWEAGQFLPYAFGGVAVGRADVSRAASVSGSYTDTDSSVQPSVTTGPFAVALPGPQTDAQNGMFAYGFAAGLGVDVALLQNVFVRGEWEYVGFAPIKGMSVSMNSLRGAAGLKF